MIVIIDEKSQGAVKARKVARWTEIEPGIFVGDYKNIKDFGG